MPTVVKTVYMWYLSAVCVHKSANGANETKSAGHSNKELLKEPHFRTALNIYYDDRTT